MRSQLAVLIAALSSVALVGCDDSINCGDRFIYDEARMRCACGPDLVEIEGGACMLPDGGVIIPPGFDAGPPRDAHVPPDAAAMPDAGTDACTETTFYRDADMDGFGDAAMTMTTCGEVPTGYVDNDDDCDDECAECNPDGTEICDGLDNNCDGMVDEGVLETFFRDADMDGFGDPTMPMQACAMPDGFVDNDDDCNDECVTCRPGGTEVCEGSLDEDCDGTVDGGCTCTIGVMRACPGGSNVGECIAGTQTCTTAGEWGACGGAVGPATETCNALDDDCDGVPDEDPAATSCGAAPRATGRACSAGACTITSCVTGWGDCDASYANGCEEPTGTATHCAACGDVCGWDCEASSCNDADSVGGGLFHTCAVREGGDALCWGNNGLGQLGNGTTTDRATPVAVSGLSSGVAAITTGSFHTCALLTTGSARCWGDNTSGELGDGTTTRRLTPAVVTGLSSGVSAIAAGRGHTCALLASGAVQCWGDNAYGQLGIGSTTDRSTPVTVSGLALSTVGAIAAGSGHACALLSTGAVRCWGRNLFGQIGDGSTTDRHVPVNVSGLSSGVVAIAAGGYQTCALLSTGAVRCWGYNDSGQIGDGTMTSRSTPTLVSGLSSGATAIAVGGGHACATSAGGALRCWGSNSSGQVGDGTVLNRSAPVLVPGLATGVVAVSAGGAHSCAILSTGALECWGNNDAGRLGDGTTMRRTSPVAVLPP